MFQGFSLSCLNIVEYWILRYFYWSINRYIINLLSTNCRSVNSTQLMTNKPDVAHDPLHIIISMKDRNLKTNSCWRTNKSSSPRCSSLIVMCSQTAVSGPAVARHRGRGVSCCDPPQFPAGGRGPTPLSEHQHWAPVWHVLCGNRLPPFSPAHKPLLTPRPLARPLHRQPVA